MYLRNSFIRKVRCGYISLHPAFRAHAGRSEGPGILFAFNFVIFLYIHFLYES